MIQRQNNYYLMKAQQHNFYDWVLVIGFESVASVEGADADWLGLFYKLWWWEHTAGCKRRRIFFLELANWHWPVLVRIKGQHTIWPFSWAAGRLNTNF